ncbi:Potassium voltage-gated channel protein Shaker [Aphelenchoides besseyi]|nr:Potassium voltage-gated channel protein Shaker [Aphelenchoides besseyi]
METVLFDNSNDLVTFNVAGQRFQTRRSTLCRYPQTVLGDQRKLERYWNPETNEYFMDRNRLRQSTCNVCLFLSGFSFEAILYIYQSNGETYRPKTVTIQNFLHELKFFGFEKEVIANFWKNEGYLKPEEEEWPSNRLQRQVWEFFEYPQSSRAATVLGTFSILIIVISIISFIVETMPEFSTEDRQWKSPFFWIEFVCNCWFLFEFMVRFLTSPNKITFLKKVLNLLDLAAIIPFFGTLIWSTISESNEAQSQNFAILRVVRVARIFKLTRHSMGLQVLIQTFTASQQELTLMAVFLVIGLVLFSSGMYFAENNEPDSNFDSIPGTFWFTLATITTVGFGDMSPTSTYGKLIGGICAIVGVITMTFPISIIITNFRDCYRHANRMASLKRQQLFDETHARAHAETGCDLVRNCKLRSSIASSSSDED